MNLTIASISVLLYLVTGISLLNAQTDSCLFTIQKKSLLSDALNDTREYWLSLPQNYDSTKEYPVVFVLDAQWRMNLVCTISRQMQHDRHTQPTIIVGIPHPNWKKTRAIDLTFSTSTNDKNGTPVDSNKINTLNSGEAERFYTFLIKELLPELSQNYKIGNDRTIIGHSYSGYFLAYILGRDHSFTTFHLYDPSMWYNNGEAIRQIVKTPPSTPLKIYVSHQKKPTFHANKIEEFILTLEKQAHLDLRTHSFENENHGSLYMPSFIEATRLFAPSSTK